MHPHEVELPSGSHNSVYHTFVIAETRLHVIVSPCVIVKKGAVGLCKSMKIDRLALFVFKVAPLYVQHRQLMIVFLRSRFVLRCFRFGRNLRLYRKRAFV